MHHLHTAKIAEYSEKYPTVDFSESEYAGAKGLMSARCRVHGDTINKTGAHWNTNGCPKCGEERARAKNRANSVARTVGFRKFNAGKQAASAARWAEFVFANSDKYDFSRVVLRRMCDPVEVRCMEHGIWFTPEPKNMLNGHGCPECGMETAGRKIRAMRAAMK